MFHPLWQYCGWALALLVPLLAFILLTDRSKGRRRCPKCWYSMDGVTAPSPSSADSDATPAPITCPECGHSISNPKSLLKHRRRASLLPILLVTLILAYITWCIPRVHAEGRTGWIPTTILAAFFAAHPQSEDDFSAEMSDLLEKRLTNDRVPFGHADLVPWRWQANLAAFRIRITYTDNTEKVCRLYNVNDLLHRRCELDYPYTMCNLSGPVDPVGVRWIDERDDVLDVVTSCVRAEDWNRNGGDIAEVDCIGSYLVAFAPESHHREITALLHDIRSPLTWNSACPALRDQSREHLAIVNAHNSSADQPRVVVHQLSDFLDYQWQLIAALPDDDPTYDRYVEAVIHDLLEIIACTVEPDCWAENGGDIARTQIYGTLLVVDAPPSIQLKVQTLLTQIRQARTSPPTIHLKNSWVTSPRGVPTLNPP